MAPLTDMGVEVLRGLSKRNGKESGFSIQEYPLDLINSIFAEVNGNGAGSVNANNTIREFAR